jgi:predicted Holliday junction resolvase-like endonuclease
MDQVCVLAVWFINVILLIIALFVLSKINKNIKLKREFEERKFNFSVEPKETDFMIIDQLIQDNLAEYRILKLESVEKLYINEETQNKIFEYVLRKVMYQLSPIYLEKLSYIYNKDKLDEIIAQKINMYILDYTVEVNGNIRS